MSSRVGLGGSKTIPLTTISGSAATGGSATTVGGAATGGSLATGGSKSTGGTASTGGTFSSSGAGNGVLIHNDEFWKDTTGAPIYSQGGGVLKVGNTYPADYLSIDPATRVFNGSGREGNAMFKYDGRYYLCSSDLHGWNASLLLHFRDQYFGSVRH